MLVCYPCTLMTYLLLTGDGEEAPVLVVGDGEGALGVAVQILLIVRELTTGRSHLVCDSVQHLDVQLFHLQ